MNLDDGTLSRAHALSILDQWMNTEEFPDRMLGAVPPFRRPFTMDLVYTTVRHVRALAFLIDRLVPRRPERSLDYAALLLGAAQIFKMPDVAEHAEVFSTVEAFKFRGGLQTAGFVNGVLRNLLRQKPVLEQALASAPLAVRESHPDDQVARWTERFGIERAEALCKWDNEPAGVTVVTLPGKLSAPELLSAFQDAGVNARLHPGVPSRAICLPHGSHLDQLPGFSEGWFSIQDPATLEAVRLLDVKPGQHVLDACAAPGGKTVQIASALGLMGKTGCVAGADFARVGEKAPPRRKMIAMDCWRDRLDPLRENLQRLGLASRVSVRVGDAARVTLRDLGDRPFDRILADVPCSNTGVQRRRADARWRFNATRLASLAKSQRAILSNLAELLAPGGRLVYSTCSIEAEENGDVVEAFLADHPDFRLVEKTTQIPPDRACDGAFAAALERRR